MEVVDTPGAAALDKGDGVAEAVASGPDGLTHLHLERRVTCTGLPPAARSVIRAPSQAPSGESVRASASTDMVTTSFLACDS